MSAQRKAPQDKHADVERLNAKIGEPPLGDEEERHCDAWNESKKLRDEVMHARDDLMEKLDQNSGMIKEMQRHFHNMGGESK